MPEATVTRRIVIPENKVAEVKEAILRIREPGSWADNHTTRAFQAKYGMTVDEAERVVGKPTWPLVWVAPEDIK